ncbi:universal stress protein YxiE-like [Saccostrea echinata]|uniref:universal stress protein YxiE-like n=1 Tax=Saccostrea echinata TaxID=191078 RepID=UPI002A807662|nr:universal stress protein YxiE-like [Saccostrea echinata]
MKKILIAVDGSKESMFALNEYMKKVHNDDKYAVVIHCAHYSISNPEELAITRDDAQTIKDILQKDEQRISNVIEHIETLLKQNKIPGEVVRLEGKPESAIISKAEELNASLIVMGSRGLGTIRRTILGSVSEFVLHHSHIPVMICKCESKNPLTF